VRKWIRGHSLSIAAIALFVAAFVGQVLTGRAEYNQDQQAHGEEPVPLVQYLATGHFGEATLENWESEFLQMAVFVFLTAFLVQRGSAESKKPKDEPGAGEEPSDEDPAKHRNDPRAPWPVRRGGIALALYRNSLSIVLFLLFLASFWGHAMTGAVEYSAEQLAHGDAAVGTLGYLATSRFWFESFQNWQSEFLSVFAIAVLSIWLRQQHSPESKPVHAPYEQTGEE
jgi:membrane protein implicated in regulation of membrane protease activity